MPTNWYDDPLDEFDSDWEPEVYVPEKEDLPPNVEWDTKTQERVLLKPGEEGYDKTWGYGRELDPLGDTKEDKWLKSVYEYQTEMKQKGWELPCPPGQTRNKKSGECETNGGPPPDKPVNGDGPTPPQPEYKYYGTDPYQDWDVDLSYLRDAPAFEFEAEPWVEPEAFTYPAYERIPEYERPDPFSYEAFTAPSAEEVLAEDPGYQFRLDEGLRGMEAGAAARGTLRGGGTLKGLIDYGQSAASQEYEKAYGRRLRDYQTGLGAAERAYATNLGAGEREYVLQLGAAQQAYDRQRKNALEQAQLDRENRYQAYTTDYDRALTRARDRYAPSLLSWKEEQQAGAQAARDQYQRQWDAYKYAQPSATTIFASGL
jgi:hypothetical protein